MRNTVLIKGRVRDSSDGLESFDSGFGDTGSIVSLLLWQPNPNASNVIAAQARSTAPLSS
jgi:hypothetical protein